MQDNIANFKIPPVPNYFRSGCSLFFTGDWIKASSAYDSGADVDYQSDIDAACNALNTFTLVATLLWALYLDQALSLDEVRDRSLSTRAQSHVPLLKCCPFLSLADELLTRFCVLFVSPRGRVHLRGLRDLERWDAHRPQPGRKFARGLHDTEAASAQRVVPRDAVGLFGAR